jgi:gamma-glutamyltranspeptidase/glutathione hydrolase
MRTYYPKAVIGKTLFKEKTRMKFFIALCLVGMLPLSAHAIPSEGHQIMISAPSAYAVEVGKKIAAMGGNVADVAVAVGLTLNVTTPYYASMGGGGFALVKMNKDAPIALDFRETAPQKTAPDFYTSNSKRSSQDGGAAVGVPGNPMGLYELHKKYGKLPWKTLFALPVKLAEEGFQVSGEWVDKTSGEEKRFSPAGIKSFFKKGRKAYLPGEVMRQPQLAKALRVFRDHGPQGIYAGAVAKDIASSVQKAGGVLSETDLAHYKVRWLQPLKTKYENYEIYLMPPPSSGGVVIAQALSMITSLDLVKRPFLSVDELHLLGEIQSRAFRGRALLADPDFHKNPLEELLNESSLKKLAKTVNLKKAVQLKPVSEPQDSQKESTETTHFVVMDEDGNAVTLTTTLNGNYGSGVVSEKFGIALNNEMDDFTTHPGQPNMFGLVQGQGNVVEPGKRPLSSMSPTLAMKDGKTVLALGAPGGPRIISSVLQVLYRVLGQNMDLDVAVQAPRVHHQYLPNVLYVDKQALSPLVIQALEKRGHKVEESWMAKVYAVQRDNDGVLKAAFDHRGEGAVGGF